MPSYGTTWTYEHEPVRCGKPGCKRCPHGPYWYRYKREDGRLKKEYVGKELPFELNEQERAKGTARDDHELMLAPGGRKKAVAYRVLRLAHNARYPAGVEAFRRAWDRIDHLAPRGHMEERAVEMAWDWIKSYNGW